LVIKPAERSFFLDPGSAPIKIDPEGMLWPFATDAGQRTSSFFKGVSEALQEIDNAQVNVKINREYFI